MVPLIEELGETSRRMILARLREGPQSVGELVEATGLKQPNVSNHLNRMRSRGIVNDRRMGRKVIYTLANQEVAALVGSLLETPSALDDTFDRDHTVRDYAQYATQGDEPACQRLIDTCFRAGMPLIDVYETILTPAMTMIGDWYKSDAIDVGQEHMASSITERLMARTFQIVGPSKNLELSCVLGCAPNAHHTIGLRMIADYLRLRGWKPLFLGANVPETSFLNIVRIHRPTMVLLSVASEEGVLSTSQLIQALHRLRREQPFIIGLGGHVSSRHKGRFTSLGVDFIASDLTSFAKDILPEIEASGRAPEGSRPTTRDN